MIKYLKPLTYLVSFCALVYNCANRGTPSGGEKDITPPVIIKTIPENFSTNFNAKEIKVYFDEYIKITNLQKHLIISPPMEYQPEITPLGSASKHITIKLFDTLQPNTTYAFNFGESIEDNNEGNPFPFYRYVFSTGDYIDSLKVRGSVVDAFEMTPDEAVSVMLYEIDSTFSDSIIYKQKPKYITNTVDSTVFEIQNVKAGNYLMIALKDENSNYTFQPNEDKIGFVDQFITLPQDSLQIIELFKQELDFKATRPKQIAGQKIAFGYEGDYKGISIDLLSDFAENFEYKITKDPEQDSLNYWYKPKLEVDSLLFKVSKQTFIDTFTVRLKDLPKDSLIITGSPKNSIHFKDDFIVEANTPLIDIDTSKINFIDKDSIKVKYTYNFDEINNKYVFDFNKAEEDNYTIEMLPGTFTDFFENTNDTLNYSLRTRNLDDYGNIRLSLQNVSYPIIVQIVSERGEIYTERYSEKQEVLDFYNVSPGKYNLRVIFDSNNNKKYDSGNYLKKIQSERVSYYPKLIEIRAGWDEVIQFELLD